MTYSATIATVRRVVRGDSERPQTGAVPATFEIPAAIRYALRAMQNRPVTNDARCAT